jgi:hypothetical protein
MLYLQQQRKIITAATAAINFEAKSEKLLQNHKKLSFAAIATIAATCVTLRGQDSKNPLLKPRQEPIRMRIATRRNIV